MTLKKKLKPRKIGFSYDNFMLLHENHKRPHPERPSRVMSIYTYLEESETNLLSKCMRLKCPFAKLKHIERVHSKEMIETVEKSRYNKHKLRDEGIKELKEHGKDVNYLEYDVYTNRYTYEAALMAAGACVEACKAIFKREDVDSVYAAVRPPGHHAEQCKVQGFCIFNNVAVAARYLQDKCGVKKVCIFDWDIHCGDGIQEIFYEDDTVLYVSMHRYDDNTFYPADHKASPKLFGKGKGFGYNWSFGYDKPEKTVTDLDYIFACHTYLFPKIAAFQPEVILISSGFDSALNDPLGGIGLTPIGYAWMTHGLVKICPKVITVLEGGYNLQNLSRCSEAVLLALQLQPEDDAGFAEVLT